METTIATTSFDCCDKDGNEFVAELHLGAPYARDDSKGRKYFACDVSFEPLFPEQPHRGEDTFQAICLAIELVRKALRAFAAHGGKVYFRGTRSPIDIDDPSFCPIAEPIRNQFLASEIGLDTQRGWPNGKLRRDE